MKKKILFALAMPAFLAACTNEEIVDVQSSEMKEVVGAELVSNGLTIDFSEETQSRMTAAGQFDDSDKLGLGWITTTGPSTTQSESVLPNLNKLYGNHLFVKDGNAEGAFTTYSNVYTGWHFAYYPYTRMPQVDQIKIANINPAMTKEYTYNNGTNAEYMENRFHISAMDFIKPTDVDAETNALVGKKFNLLPMVSTFTVAANVANDILAEADLKTLKITKLELQADKDLFFTSAELNPQYLPQAVYTDVDPTAKVQLEYDAAETKASMTVGALFSTGDATAIKKTGKSTTLSTEINVGSYKLDGTKELRMNILPLETADLYATSTPSAITLKVYVEGGYFTVKYTNVKKDAQGNTIPYTATESANNTAITKVANLLSVAGHSKTIDGKPVSLNWDDLIGNEAVRVSLAKENFTADYTGIKTYGQWTGCVKVANALGKNEIPTFVLGEGAKVEFPAGTMFVPNKGVKVTSAVWGDNQLIFKGKTTWSTNISGCDNGTTILVDETGELTVESAMWASRIVNKGTILAGGLSSIGDAASDRFDNAEGRVVVEYGAYVYPSTGKEGIIAYNVDGTESAAKINTLIANTGNIKGHAKVNTLVIENNVELDLNKSDANDVDNDRYNGSVVVGSPLANLKNVSIEMNGGTIKAKQGAIKEVLELTVLGGENLVKDVNIVNGLSILNGTVYIDASEYQEKKIVAGKEVTVSVKDAAQVQFIDIESEGTLNVNVDTYTTTINNNGVINVSAPYTLYWTKDMKQSGSQKGNIKQVSAYTMLLAALENDQDITLAEDVVIPVALAVKEDITIDLNGHTISPSADFKYTSAADLGLISVTDGATVTIKNGSLDASEYNGGIAAVSVAKGTVIIEEGTSFKVNEDGNERNDLIYVKDKNEGNKCIINGGEFQYVGTKGNGWLYTLNTNNHARDQYVFTVNGGRFYQFIPGTTNPDGWAYEVQLGAGKKVYKNDEVTPTTDLVSEDGAWYTVK